MARKPKIDSQIDWSTEPDLASLHRAHRMLQTDPTTALIELKTLAVRGSVMSMVYVGTAYKLGKGTRIDFPEAEKWFRRAFDAGSLLGCYLLGRLYFDQKRYAEAKDMFSVATARDYIPAIHLLGRIYASGRGVEKDFEKAQQYLERASNGGSVLAKGTLAYLLIHGRLGPRRLMQGTWLYLGALVDLIVVVCTEGRTSDRLR